MGYEIFLHNPLKCTKHFYYYILQIKTKSLTTLNYIRVQVGVYEYSKLTDFSLRIEFE